MEDFVICPVIGALLGSTARRAQPRSGFHRRLSGWLNKRRFESIRAKAAKGGFVNLFDERWKDRFEHVPFDELVGLEGVRVYHEARLDHASERK